ncbi:MAG TPA: hypothetical protein PK542_03375 [Treponemataceae bacterium]|nr:hypothetical protein [Treponemataceae bacterium]HPS43508.1 hypothetical protein [Treponemataceae bacterium]
MNKSSNFYVGLATKDGFNTSVRHINGTLDLLDSCGANDNIADQINSLLAKKALEAEQVLSVVNMLLVEKWGYSVSSKNLSSVAMNAESVSTITGKWKAVDMVIGYHHPDLGFLVLNPKNPENAALIAGFRKNELVVLYAGDRNKKGGASDKASASLSALFEILEGKEVHANAALLNGPYTFVPPAKPAQKRAYQARAKAPRAAKAPVSAVAAPVAAAPVAVAATPTPAPVPVAAAPSQSKLSAMVSVVVTNELFHNGNVEAWKRIIRSYNAKYPNLQVLVYYDGERIVDINTLFKWGKVKHGSCIQFAVAGENIQDLAKLSRYFRQGASSSFEAFLHGSPDTVMNLF